MRRGTRVAAAYVAVTADGSGINEEIVDSVDAAGDDMDDKGREHGDRYGEGFSDGFLGRMRNRVAGRLGNVLGSKDVAGAAGDEAGESFVDRMSDKVRSMGDRIGSELSDRMASNPEQVRRGIDRAFDDGFADRIGDRLGSRIAASMSEAIENQSAMISGAIENAVSGNGRGGRGGKDDGLSGLIGRMFGAGSRNNFLNLIGKTVGGLVGVFEKLTALGGGGGGGAGIAAVFARLGASLPVLIPALGAVGLALSAIVSIAGALVGILTALASTITSALTGAIAVALPMMAALVTAGGLVVNAFTSMTNAQRDYLFNAFQPFKAALTGIGQIVMQQFVAPLYNGQSAIQVWSANVQRALVPLAGVAQTTAKAFADAGNTITAALSGAGFQRFFAVLGRELPTIVRSLSSALGDFLNGMMGVFAAVLPYVTQFSRYLAGAAKSFSEWANSSKGQNSIVQFVGRAVESLKVLWRFIREVGGFISDVFFNPHSQRAGNSIFASLANAFEGFRRAFAKAARSGDLERWFNDAIKFGGQLWAVIQSLFKIFLALYNSGVLTGVGNALGALAKIMDGVVSSAETLSSVFSRGIPGALGMIPNAVRAAAGPLAGLWDLIKNIITGINELAGTNFTIPGTSSTTNNAIVGPWAPGTPGNPVPYIAPIDMDAFQSSLPDLSSLIGSGNTALNNTYEMYGGYMPDPEDPAKSGGKKDKDKHFGEAMAEEWANPYIQMANAIIKRAPTLAEEIREAGRQARDVIEGAFTDLANMWADVTFDMSVTLTGGVKDASSMLGGEAVTDFINNIVESTADTINTNNQNTMDAANQMMADARTAADGLIAQARAAREAAAQRLKNAKTKPEADAALRDLQAADNALAAAKAQARKIMDDAQATYDSMIAAANASVDGLNAARQIVADQGVVTPEIVQALINGESVFNATLADFAEARQIVAEQLTDAGQALEAAINLRNNYATQVADSLRAFGSLMTAQAKTINGVQQALTSGDITDNLQERLDKIRKFNENLRQLLAMGLSESAYKQIVDAGVENGGAYAEAILAGGQGAVSEVNNLTDQIDSASTMLGNAAANHMYQAGVEAATGFYNGLVSLNNELTTAATALGETIANAVKKALGIASPSKVMFDLMHDDVGDGVVNGLDAAQGKVGLAASRLAAQVAVSPEVAAYAASQGAAPTVEGEAVSGNGKTVIWNGDIVTPTEDPVAVSNEVLNELTGRL